MERMICFACIVFIACTFHVVRGVTHYPRIHYMEERCNQTVTVSLDLRLKLTFDSEVPLKVNWTCRVTMQSDLSDNMLLAKFIDINTDESERCRDNGIKIFASNNTLMNGPNGDCGITPPNAEFLSGGRSLTFEFHTNFVRQTGNFDILITPLSLSQGNESCPDETFHCKNDRCVSVYVTCNGFNDCGDDSDETDNCAWISTIIVGTVAAILVAAVIISLVIFLVQFKRRKYRRLARRPRQHSADTPYYHDHPHNRNEGYQHY